MDHAKLTDKRLIEAAKEALGNQHFESDEALENYYYEDLNWTEFAREFVSDGYWGEVSAKLADYLDYKSIGAELAKEFYVANGVVFDRDMA